MNTKDKEALQKITYGNSYTLNYGVYDKRIDSDSLPVKRVSCKRSDKCIANKNNTNMYPIEKVYMSHHRKGVICRCSICGALEVFPMSFFEQKEKASIHLDDSTEARKKALMRLQGVDEEDIKEICDLKRDEFKKEDAQRKIEKKNFEASRKASYEEVRRDEESKTFKARVDAGEIKFDVKARAFYEVATGIVVKKL